MTTRLNVALPNVPGIKSLLRSSSARLLHRGSIFQLAATNGSATPWKTDTICLFLPPSLFTFNFDLYFKNSVVQSSHLYSSFYFSHRFGSVKDSVQSISLHYVSMSPPLVFLLFIPIFPLFQSLFSTRSTPIFALFSHLLFLSSPSLSSISLPQRFLSNHFSPFLFLIPFLHLLLPLFYHFYLLKIPSNDIVFSLPFFFFPPLSFHVPPVSFLVQRLSLSVFLRSIIDRKPEPRSTFISRPLFSFHIYLFQLCPFCTIDRPLKFTFAPSLLVSSSSFSRLVSSASKVETVQFFHLSNFYPSPLPSRFTAPFFSFFLLFPPGFAPFSRNISRYRGGTPKKLADRLISEQDTSFFPQFRFIRAVCIVFSPSSFFPFLSRRAIYDRQLGRHVPLSPPLPCDEHHDYRFIPRYREAISPYR